MLIIKQLSRGLIVFANSIFILKVKFERSVVVFMSRSETFVFGKIPASLAEFSALPEAELKNPFQAAALTVLAICRYCDNPQSGIEMLNFLKGPQPLSTYEQQFLRDRLTGKKYLPYSFFEGASVQNNYTPSEPLTIIILDDPYSYAEEGYAKLLIKSSGADQVRPIKLRRKGQDQWFLWEQFLLSSIREPVAADPWA